MSDEAIPRHVVGEWVRTRRVDNPATKLLLMLVFDHAGPQEDGRWVAWVGNRRLAEEACFAEGANGQRTVRKHLAALQAAGLVDREERRRDNGSQTTNRVVLLVDSPGGPHSPGGEDSTVRGGRTPQSPPEAPIRSPNKSQRKESAREIAQTIPEGFPEELRAHARIVLPVLRSVAEQHGCREVTPRAVALVLMSRPRRPVVKVAHDLAAWAQNPPRPIRDVLATYRTFLDREPDLAAIEQMPGQQSRFSISGTLNGGRPRTKGERVDERIAMFARMAAANDERTAE